MNLCFFSVVNINIFIIIFCFDILSINIEMMKDKLAVNLNENVGGRKI
jgi:hypothetical protein